MNIKLKNKKHIMKISAFAVLLVFVSALLFNMNVVDTKAQDMKEISINNKVKVLEVGPGNYSRLSNSGIGTTTDGDYEITYMSMPEFISKVDDISGLYDVIAITNNNTSLNATLTNDNLAQYVQYSPQFSQEMTYLKYDSAIAPASGHAWPRKSGEKLNDGNTYREFYSENDITDKRAKEIIESINRGQLVYIENSVLIDGTKLKSNFEGINKSNFKKVNTLSLSTIKDGYNNSTKKPSVTNFYYSKDDISNPSSSGLGKGENRNLTFKFKVDNVSDNFKVNIYLDWNADGIFNYANDTSDGSRNELVKTVTLSANSRDSDGYYTIVLDNNEVRRTFVGYLDWDVEIFSDTNESESFKTNVVGSSTFKRIKEDGKINLKVLQVYPNNSMYRLAGDSEFVQYLNSVDDYKITMDSMKVDDFNNNSSVLSNYDMIIIGFGDAYGGNSDFTDASISDIKKFIAEGKAAMFTHDTMALSTSESKEPNGVGPTKLTEAFKSIIGQSRYENDTAKIQKYSTHGLGAIVNEDGSVTFRVRYDGLSLNLAGTMNEWGDISMQKGTDGVFECTLGSEYFDTNTEYQYKYHEGSNWFIDSKNNYKGTLNNNTNSIVKISDSIIEFKSLGQTNLVANDATSNNQTNYGLNLYNRTKTKTVREVNNAQITEYPYKLDSTGITAGDTHGKNMINVALTHTQWYQLDLEDEELVPWFNLYTDGTMDNNNIIMNSGDARNFYYTYSKGNITYSGTGHTTGSEEFPDSEKKLFVNTIIKAARGATNTAPEIESYEISTSSDTDTELVNNEYRKYFENEQEISVESNNDYKFYTTAYDDDADDVDITVTVTDEQTGQQLVNTIQGTIKKGDNINERVEINIPQNVLYEYGLAEKRIKVTVNADDNYKDTEVSGKDTKVYYIKPSAELETYNIQHGMYNLTYAAGDDLTQLTDGDKLPEINTWYEERTFNDRLVSNTTNQVSYFATVPFAAKTTVYKGSSLELTVDSNLEVSGDVKVYKIVKDTSGGESLLYIKDMTLQDNVYTCDLSELTDFTTDIVVKYKAKTMAQPEVTSSVTASGIQQQAGEVVTFTNNIRVLRNGDTVSSDDASVQVGRIILDRDLF